jgi:hypothetical protein
MLNKNLILNFKKLGTFKNLQKTQEIIFACNSILSQKSINSNLKGIATT